MTTDAYKANVLAGADRQGDDDKDYRISTILDNRLFACKRMHPDAKRIERGNVVMLHERKGRGTDFSDYLFVITTDTENYGEVRGAAVQQVLTFSNRLSHKAFHDAVQRIVRGTGGDISKEATKVFAYE